MELLDLAIGHAEAGHPEANYRYPLTAPPVSPEIR